MIVTLDTDHVQTLDQVRGFLNGSAVIDLQIQTRADAYRFVERPCGGSTMATEGRRRRACSDAPWAR